jgi:hypothetical protein
VNVKAILEVGQYLNGAWALDDQMRKHGPQQHRNILRAVDLPNADRLPSSEFSTFVIPTAPAGCFRDWGAHGTCGAQALLALEPLATFAGVES